MQTEILQYLNLSLVPDSTTLKTATAKLGELSKQPSTFSLIIYRLLHDDDADC